ncbi:hypothetical protein SEA_FAUST_273 [Streptomyces phage Faust]|uniref:Uncharacterized protein n=1 Tax=Streptomyces phage Faust TaxID=2767565 RepID=A0A7G9UYK2_9CAUD|nr:hypothetical protein PP456_gp001 [Streptomyces phage Faust]YP_010651852.1 hypothetical protein PP456_gp014 [Streptomyces phage Faust]QNN99107.1 hypothetical protein SEA_FAUST_1 [Streptomyces phage Faust]QNN99345.1 hypothetical protein SEA_FAUST_273 [Streptomyces phage Faust]
MAIALQYMDRPNSKGGAVYGGYCINDGTNTVFIETKGQDNLVPVYRWLGNGTVNVGRDYMRDNPPLSMPTVVLNAQQYNALVTTLPTDTQRAFKKGD